MTMHVVLGDGEMTRKELTETLQDLWKADEEAGATFWFLLQGKKDPTATDQALVKWLETNDIYYEVLTDDADSMDGIYSQPQETHVAKQLSRKVVSLLNSKPEEGEESELLALFFSDDSSAEEDRWLNQVCQDVFDAGIKVRALNDGLLEVDLSEETTKAESDEVPDNVKTLPVKKAVAKKGGAAPRRDTQVSEEDETPPSGAAGASYTREALEEMELPALKEIAKAKGIEFPPRTRMTTYIDAILGEDKPAVEVTQPEGDGPSTVATPVNGINVEAIADAIIQNIIRRLEVALGQ
jgi:hypothetical protein